MRDGYRWPCVLFDLMSRRGATPQAADLAALVGPARRYRPQRLCLPRGSGPPKRNPPESWILLMQYANLPFDKPVDPRSPALGKVLCGLLWEEVRPVRQVELTWPASSRSRPSPDEISPLLFRRQRRHGAHLVEPADRQGGGPAQGRPDGRTFIYSIPVDTWGVVALLRGTSGHHRVVLPGDSRPGSPTRGRSWKSRSNGGSTGDIGAWTTTEASRLRRQDQ